MSKARHGELKSFIRKAALSDTDECIIWSGALSDDYLSCRWDGKTQRAHRVVLQIASGETGDGLLALHDPMKCSNRKCINPRHLYWGTPEDNTGDKRIEHVSTQREKARYANKKKAEALYRKRRVCVSVRLLKCDTQTEDLLRWLDEIGPDRTSAARAVLIKAHKEDLRP